MPDRPACRKFAPSAGFVLRTPLLPFEELRAFGCGLEAPEVDTSDATLDDALARDRQRLSHRLFELLERPEIREAFFLGSPGLLERAQGFLSDPKHPRRPKAELALLRYFTRMTYRSTPFGLFAGCTLGSIGKRTRLRLAPREAYRRHARLDMDYLCALADQLSRDPNFNSELRYFVNSSLYRWGDRFHYAEWKPGTFGRSYHLVVVDATDYLSRTLGRATDGAKIDELSASLVADDPEVSPEEAHEFIASLIDSQILVSELEPPVTGPEPLRPLCRKLASIEAAGEVVATLRSAEQLLSQLDDLPPGEPPQRYRELVARLETLPAPVDAARLFQVDLFKPADEVVIGKRVVDEYRRATEVLWRIANLREDRMHRFRDAFLSRYGAREVPLIEALDEEAGIGFETVDSPGTEVSPLLEGVNFTAPRSEETTAWQRRENHLLQRLCHALEKRSHEVELIDRDLDILGPNTPAPLPDAFAVMGRLAARSPEALAAGDFRLLVEYASGPSGATLIGRFCHGNQRMGEFVRGHFGEEEAHRPDAIYAEIAHLPEGRLGNVLLRPVLRDYEIPYLGNSSVPREHQIPITDLVVSVRGDRVVLRSNRLAREIVPRLTSAHNYEARSLGLYRFLCALQSQGFAGGMGWLWRPLENAPFLPRVVYGRLVLSRARWRVDSEEIRQISKLAGSARFRWVRAWRAARRIPRYVAISDEDNELLIDLENALYVDLLAGWLGRHEWAALLEVFPSPDELCVEGPEGSYFHELLIPFACRTASGTQETQLAGRLVSRQKISASATEPSTTAVTGDAESLRANPPAEGHVHETEGRSAAVAAAPADSTDALDANRADASRANTRRKSGDRLHTNFMPTMRRDFPPGTDWLFVSLYTGPAGMDHLLRELVRPVIDRAREHGVLHRWFFIRYSDPSWHLRLRLESEPHSLQEHIQPDLERQCADALDRRRVWKIELGTYEREIERYGGPEGIVLAEQVFEADSDAVLGIVETLSGDAGADARWRLALRGIDALLADLGLDLPRRLALMRGAYESFATEFKVDADFRRELSNKHRKLRRDVAAALRPEPDPDDWLAPGVEVLKMRSHRLATVGRAFREAEELGRLTWPLSDIAASLVHMHVNRVLRSAHRAQELVLYFLLYRHYESLLARGNE